MSRTKIYRIYRGIIARCYNKNLKTYKRYGGRGILVCDEWRYNFLQFYTDVGDCPDGMTLERIDNNLGYSKGNCKWATMREQNNNRSTNLLITYNGKTQTAAQWERELNLGRGRLYIRKNLCQNCQNEL